MPGKKIISMGRTFYRKDWVLATGLPLMGWISGCKGRVVHTLTLNDVLFGGMAVSMLCYARMVNDYYDARIEGEKNALSEEQDISRKLTQLLVNMPLVVSIVLLVLADVTIAAKAFSVFFLATVWAYSSPPLRIRNWRTCGTIGNMASAAGIFSAGYFVHGTVGADYAIMVNAVAVAFLLNELVHQLDHGEKDKACGRTTVANRWGLEKTKKIIYIAFGYHAIFNAVVLLTAHGREQWVLVAVTVIANAMRYLVVRKITPETPFGKIRSRLYNKEEVLAFCACWIVIGALPIFSSNGQRPDLPNIIVMSIDTLRADHLGCYGYGKGTSPNIDAFASKALLFENAYSQAPVTSPAHMSIFTGLMPSVHGVTNYNDTEIRKLDPRIATFPGMLKDHGFLTVGLHAGAMMSSEFGFDRGFDVYSEKLISYNWHRACEDPKDLNVIRKLLETSRRDSSPLFLFLHHYVCHDPYTTAPEAIRSRFLTNPVPGLSRGLPDDELKRILGAFETAPGSGLERLQGQRAIRSTFAKEFWAGVDLRRPDHRQHVVALYDAGVAFADILFGKLLDLLREEGSYDNSIIILLSDHGEEFFEHGGKTHWQLFVETLHVPLIIKLPSRYASPAQGRIAQDVRTVDLFPTLFDLLGLPVDHPIQGESFLSLMKKHGRRYSPLVVSYDGNLNSLRFVKDDFVYSDFMSRSIQEWLFFRPNDADEQRNLAPSEPAVLGKMRAIAADVRLRDAAFRTSIGTGQAPLRSKPSESLLQQLRALGYVGGSDPQ